MRTCADGARRSSRRRACPIGVSQDGAMTESSAEIPGEVREYIEALEPAHRQLFDRLQGLILEVQPDAEVVFSYQIPMYKVGKLARRAQRRPPRRGHPHHDVTGPHRGVQAASPRLQDRQGEHPIRRRRRASRRRHPRGRAPRHHPLTGSILGGSGPSPVPLGAEGLPHASRRCVGTRHFTSRSAIDVGAHRWPVSERRRRRRTGGPRR